MSLSLDNISAYERFMTKQLHRDASVLRQLKIGIWLYFGLLITEGALRKWFLPFLATPLLVVRDPVALWVVFVALHKKILQFNTYVIAFIFIATISFFAAITLGHGNIIVALFGFRILFIHFPFMFAIGSVFSREDVIRIGKVVLWIAIPMAVLIGIQFYSPQTAWVNKGFGDENVGGGFSGALGFFRPPGTFSFATGNIAFFHLAAAFVCYFFLNTGKINRLILIGATIAVMAAIPLSLTRSLVLLVSICVAFMLFAFARKPQYIGNVALGIIGVLILFFFISQLDFFKTATDALTNRFTVANENEGGFQSVIEDRYFGGLVYALTNTAQLPFFGYGLGMGTNVGASLLSGKVVFLISEGEWGRLIGEMGLLLGLFIIILRVGFGLQLMILSYRQLSRNNTLPWMMLSYALLYVTQGQWAQPTGLGFSTLAGGLVLASLRPSAST